MIWIIFTFATESFLIIFIIQLDLHVSVKDTKLTKYVTDYICSAFLISKKQI